MIPPTIPNMIMNNPNTPKKAPGLIPDESSSQLISPAAPVHFFRDNEFALLDSFAPNAFHCPNTERHDDLNEAL